MKKVLIISYSFPPINNIAARRFPDMLNFFQESGWTPYVLTTNSQGDLVVNLAEKNIFRIGSRPANTDGAPKGSGSILARLRRKTGFMLRSYDSSCKEWAQPVLNNHELLSKLKAVGFDLILSSYGPAASLWIGSKLSKQLRTPWAVDFRDLGALHRDVGFNQNLFCQLLDRKIEKRIISTARGITTVSKGLSEEIAAHYSKPLQVIYNGWSKLEVCVAEADVELPDNYIHYAGRLYLHQMDAVYLLVNALANSGFNLVMRSLGPRHLERKIIDYAESVGAENKLFILPPDKAAAIATEQQRAKLNLVVEDMQKTYSFKKGVLTGKLLQLLTFSAPVLAIARDDSEIGEILSDTQKGKLISNPTDLEVFLAQMETKNQYQGYNNSIWEYSKERQAYKLCRFMDEMSASVNV